MPLFGAGKCHCFALDNASCGCWRVPFVDAGWCWKVPCVNVGAGKCHKMYASHCLCQVQAYFCLSQATSAEDRLALDQLQAIQAQDIRTLHSVLFLVLTLRLWLKEQGAARPVPGHHIVACQSVSAFLCIIALGWQTSLPMTGLLQIALRRRKKPKRRRKKKGGNRLQ